MATSSYTNLSTLKTLTADSQIAELRKWFYENFQDPATECPYESAEGGYQYIYGGPYDAYEVLEAEFGEIISKSVLQSVAEELAAICPEWSGRSKD